MPRVLAALVCALLLVGCRVLPDSSSAEQPVVTFARDERAQAPEIVAETLDGQRLALADFEGPVVVNFWASWCGPCGDEAPHLNAVDRLFADRGVRVIGVNTGVDSRVNAETFVRDNGLVFPSWYDPEQAIAASFGDTGPVGLPTTLVLDAEHRVAVRFFGGVTGATLTPYLEQLLADAG